MGLIPDGLAKKLGITINTARVTANDSNETKKWAKSHIDVTYQNSKCYVTK